MKTSVAIPTALVIIGAALLIWLDRWLPTKGVEWGELYLVWPLIALGALPVAAVAWIAWSKATARFQKRNAALSDHCQRVEAVRREDQQRIGQLQQEIIAVRASQEAVERKASESVAEIARLEKRLQSAERKREDATAAAARMRRQLQRLKHPAQA